MNSFEKFLYFMQGKMERPTPYGWFHLMWIGIALLCIFILYLFKNKRGEKQLKRVLATYGIIAFILEFLKQLIWSFKYDASLNIVTWDYEWYSFPFQLCTTPIYVSLICLILKKGKLRDALLSYMAFITILGSVATAIKPDTCFVSDILINIHTMWMHIGSLVVSIYLLMSGEIKIKLSNVLYGIMVFLIFVLIADILNIIIYNAGILSNETFNLFYISPYYVSDLPIFDTIQKNNAYFIFILIYILIISAGAFIVYFVALFIQKLVKKKNIYDKI